MVKPLRRAVVVVLTGPAVAVAACLVAAGGARADTPSDTGGRVAYSNVQAPLTCSSGAPTQAVFTFDYDPGALREGYSLQVTAYVGNASGHRQLDLPALTLSPGGAAGTYRGSLPLTAADAGSELQLSAGIENYRTYVSETRTVDCSTPEAAPYVAPSVTATVDCAHHTTLTFTPRDGRGATVDIRGEYQQFGVQPDGTTTHVLQQTFRAGDTVVVDRFQASDEDVSWTLSDVPVPVQAGCERNDDLFQSESLKTGQTLTSASGEYRAVMQGDGNLVVYGPDGALFSTGTQGTVAARATLQRYDSNFVLYDAAGYNPQWANGVQYMLPDESRVVMQDDGNLVEYVDGTRAVWSSKTGLLPPLLTDAGSQLDFGDTLYPNVQMTNGRFRLLMQADGNLVEYADGTRAVWSSGTAGRPYARLLVQQDGNVVVYQGSTPVWQTGTGGNENDRMVLQSDGNVVVYTAVGRPVFATGVVR